MVSLRRRDASVQALHVDRLIDCIGIQPDLRKVAAPGVRDLLAHGGIRRGPHGIGLDTGAAGKVLDAYGQPQPHMYALGSVRVGSLWESVAIPELRKQAATIAAHLLAGEQHASNGGGNPLRDFAIRPATHAGDGT